MPIFEIDSTPKIIERKQDGSCIYSKRPMVFIKLHYSKSRQYSRIPIEALLDSGSDKNLFPAHVGEAVGINIKTGQPSYHYGIGGIRLKSYKHIVDIVFKSYQFTTEIDFSYEQALPLLGREGFFVFFNNIKFVKNDKILLNSPK